MNRDKVLSYLNSVIKKAQNLAYSLNKDFRSNSSQKNKIILKSALSILKELNNISTRFYFCNGLNIKETFDSIADTEAVIFKLSSHLDPKSLIHTKLFDDNYALDEQIIKTLIEEGKNLGNLVLIIQYIKSIEKSFEFQRELWLQKKKISNKLNCSVDQFA